MMTEKQINKSNQIWEEYVCDFLFANFDWIEYCSPKRGVWIEGVTCNYIKFPKAENGRYCSTDNLQHIIDTIMNSDEQLKENIFNCQYGEPKVVDFDNAKYIIWNVIEDNPEDMEDGFIEKAFYYPVKLS